MALQGIAPFPPPARKGNPCISSAAFRCRKGRRPARRGLKMALFSVCFCLNRAKKGWTFSRRVRIKMRINDFLLRGEAVVSKGKAVLAYSGGLDTSVAIKWLQAHFDNVVIAVTMDDVGGVDIDSIRT